MGLRHHPVCPVLLCRFGVPGTAGVALGQGIATDTSGNMNVYVTGYFSGGTLQLGPGLTNAGGSDIFIVKLQSSGVFQWARRLVLLKLRA